MSMYHISLHDEDNPGASSRRGKHRRDPWDWEHHCVLAQSGLVFYPTQLYFFFFLGYQGEEFFFSWFQAQYNVLYNILYYVYTSGMHTYIDILHIHGCICVYMLEIQYTLYKNM